MLKFKEEMNARPVRQENTVPINVGQHYGFSDFSQFQSMQGGLSSFKGHANSLFFNMGTSLNFQTLMRSQPGSSYWQRQTLEQSVSHYWQPSPQPGSYYSFGHVPSHIGRPNFQTTIETQHDVDGIVDQRVFKTKNKGKKAILSPLNLGGVLEGYNEEDNNDTFLGSQFTGNILFYENVDPAKVRRGNYENVLHFLNNPYQIYLDCYMRGYLVPVTFWQELAPRLYMPDMQRLSYGTLIGWLGGEMELMIKRRPLNANWIVAYTSTISVHPKNNQFIILKDPHVIGTLDGFTRPYPSWNDVDWAIIPKYISSILSYFGSKVVPDLILSDEFPLPDYFPTTSEDSFPLLSERDVVGNKMLQVIPTASDDGSTVHQMPLLKKFALLMKSRINYGQRHINNRQRRMAPCPIKGVLSMDMVGWRLWESFSNGLHWDSMVNMCINFLHGSDSEQRTHEFILVYLVSASVYVWIRLTFCDYHNMVAILEKYEHNVDFHQIVDFVEASNISPKSTGFNEFSSNIATAVGEGSGTLTEPHHTSSPEAQQSPLTAPSSPSLLPGTTETIPTSTPTEIPTIRQYSRRARIAQSSALPTAADEPASPLGDDSQGEACPTVSGLEAGQDRANIIKTSSLPDDLTPWVTSLAADEGSMQQQLNELTDLCIRLQRQQTEMVTKIAAQDLEISNLKAKIKFLEDKDRGGAELSGEDAIIKGRSLEIREEACLERSTKKGSNDTEELVNVLTSLDAVNILTSVSVPPAVKVSTVGIPTGIGLVPTASPIFTNASVVAREMEEQMAREDQRRNKQIARDAKVARIHAEEELQMITDGLDRNNEMIAKHLHEYEQEAVELTIGEKIELINELVKYQDHHSKILKYQAQQSKPLSKKQQREFYMSVLKSHSGWKTKHFKGMSLEEIREKFILVWKQIEDFMPMASKEEGERFKKDSDMLKHFDREDLNQLWTLVKETLSSRQATSDKEKELWVELKRLEQESLKKMKTLEEVSQDDLKEIMQLVPVEELWTLVKETLSSRHATSNKEKDLWVELKRLFEPDVEDQLWIHTQALMHDPVEWRLYDTCGVHHVLSRD
nr:hypothetical protein [Tanacetum cinerariifolium]